MKFFPSFQARVICRMGLAAGLLSLGAACQTPQRQAAEEARYIPPGPQAMQVARVAYLNEPAAFVLLEVSPGYEARTGNELVTLSGGKVQSRLKIAEHRRPPYVVADVTDVMPAVGAGVFQLPE